jgi:hypothetical protein
MSLPARVINLLMSSLVVSDWALAVGASLMRVTVTVTFFWRLVSAAAQLVVLGVPQLSGSPRSVTVQKMSTLPVKLSAESKERVEPVPLTEPCAAGGAVML